MDKLNDSFLEEFLRASITNRNFFETTRSHLKYQLIPSESHKHIWKFINEFYDIEEKLPTIGIISQNFDNEPDHKKKEAIRGTLSKIKGVYVNDLYDQLIKQFQDFIKLQMFKATYNNVAELYEDGKTEDAITLLAEESQKVAEFSIMVKYYDKVYEDFVKRINENKPDDDKILDKIPTGIHELDFYIRGGHRRGTVFCALGRSGTGKSTFLRWCALHASRLGYKVFYFTCEGTRKDTLNAFDAAITATPLEQMETSGISKEKIETLIKSVNNIRKQGGEISVHDSESFDSLSIEDCYEILKEYVKINGSIDLVLFDYLEIFTTNSGKFNGDNGERRRRETISNKMTNIAVEFNCAVGTATQASDIRPDIFNNPDRVLTRSDISEFKGVVKPISYFYTINQTDDESEAEVMRLYCDKFRFHRSRQVIKIANAFNVSRFYNSRRTLEEFWDTQENKVK